MNKQYHVGIYCRLSVDDANNTSKAGKYIPADESVSIENQRELLSKIVMLNGWVEVKTYVDDGYSGGNFDRPGFQEMLEDARNGLINLILVKDLSRLGRDFVKVGQYTSDVFPALGVRFVSVLDSLDTDGDTDMLYFRSLMNDYHLRDLSKKVKSILYSKKVSGQNACGNTAPFGYLKTAEDNHKLVIDESAASIVRRIFEMRRDGMSYNRITATLNQEQVVTPRLYLRTLAGKNTDKTSRLWDCGMVKNILKNETYCGKLVMNRFGSVSYKRKGYYHKPKSEWICHEGTHEAIIPPELWDAVQMVNQQAKMRYPNRKSRGEQLFSHKLVCADCGHTMVVNVDRQPRKDGPVKEYVSYHCSIFTRSGSSVCTRHTIYEKTLAQIVTDEIREQARAVTLDEAAIQSKLMERATGNNADYFAGVRQEAAQLQRRISDLVNLTASLYEDKINGVITAETFSVLIEKNESERLAKIERLKEVQAELEKAEQDVEAVRKGTGSIRKYMDVQELDRGIVEDLIDHIEVGERQVVDGQCRRNIKIFYRFVGAVD